jgi:hypothetical protein
MKGLTMARRTLEFHALADAAADVRQLQTHGCEPQGTWSIGQICRHLAEFLDSSMHGFPEVPEWAKYRELGPAMLLRVLQGKRMKTGFPLPEAHQPPKEADAGIWPDRLCRLLVVAESFYGPVPPHPIFGPMSLDQWREMQLIHLAHHLSFLCPKDAIDGRFTT